MKKLKTYNLLMLELFGLTNHGVDILSVMKWHLKMIVGFVLKTRPVELPRSASGHYLTKHGAGTGLIPVRERGLEI